MIRGKYDNQRSEKKNQIHYLSRKILTKASKMPQNSYWIPQKMTNQPYKGMSTYRPVTRLKAPVNRHKFDVGSYLDITCI